MEVDLKKNYKNLQVNLKHERFSENDNNMKGTVINDKDMQLKTDNIVQNKKRIFTENVNDVPKKKRKFNNDLYKPPTVEELSELRETENLFHSNLFRLEIEEVLNEVKIKNKYKKLFDDWFIKLKTTIGSLEETDEIKITDENMISKLNLDISIPNIPKDTKTTFRFLKPSNISIIGSYASECTASPSSTADIMIEMPSEMFQNNDYLNYRYLQKKAIYLAYITSNIGSDLADKKTFLGSNERPILKIIPHGKLSKKVIIHIHVAVHEAAFKFGRFLPEKNNVRPQWFFDQHNTENESLLPTPHYNSIILHDLVMSRHLKSAEMIKEHPNLRDGIILLKIWLSQRHLIKGHDAFSGHLVTMYVLYLLSIKKLNTFMSSYQIIRNVWNNLVQTDWTRNGISMCQDENIQIRITQYHQYYDCVFLCSTGYYNLAAFLTCEIFSWTQQEAKLCLRHIDNMNVDSFQSLFMRKIPFYKAFDHIICIQDTSSLERIVETKSSVADKLDYGIDKRSQAIKILTKILKEGLGKRVHKICISLNETKEWNCTDKNSSDIGKIWIGLDLNPDFCFSIVDKGPEANLPDAAEFRQFWGTKSELRRFQDGSIREAVVWGDGKSISEKRIICKKIVDFLLTEKVNLTNDDYTYIANEVEELLQLNKVQITHFEYGTGEEATLRVIQAFNSLEKDLMALNDIPLSINGVQGCSPTFRYTEVFPPLATVYRAGKKVTKESNNYLMLKERAIGMVPRYVHPLEVCLQLSTSGKWPDELEAIRKTKAAFHVQIAECLRKQYNLITQGNITHVDVFKDGFVFRLRVAHQKEIAYLKQEVDENGVIKYRDNEESIELENTLFHLPKLSSALHGLHSQQPSFGATCRLTKRWLSAQLLDQSHIPDVVVELLIASMYLTPEPYKPAQMPQVAFLRIVEIFARGHWNTDPIIVNFNNEMSKEEILEVETLFRTSRNTLPPLFISTPYDQQKSVWTKTTPTLLVLNRISALAKESLKLFEDQLSNGTILDHVAIFRPPLSEYDCIIYLKPLINPRRLQAIDIAEDYPVVEWHPYTAYSKQKIPIVDFDPIQYFLKELRTSYGEFALFFHDTYGGMEIRVLLKPAALECRDFKIRDVTCRKLRNDKLVINISAMIQDFYILGKGLVKAIDISSNKLSLVY